MWVIRAVIIALVVVCVVGFANYNLGPDKTVDVDLIYAQRVDVPLITVVFWAFVGGVIVSLVGFISVYIRLTVDLRSVRKKMRALEHEITTLRNRPIEESAEFIEKQSGAGSGILPKPGSER
ncbi:MAG: LapA family protein [candidate division Zixibacteria bacterium]|nr:LapA family protein [candidate division Zixibacteria bacterium]